MELMGETDRPVAGPYRLVAELGRGGMGRVLLGVAPDGRLVAVKVVRSQFVEDDGFRTRFRREVEASSKVSGAYTAAVVDADADAPLPWLASVFVPGPSLGQVVENVAPLPPEATVRLAAGLAAALAEIHRAGLIHRDLKPSNVLLAADGPRVIDFGIARAIDSEHITKITHTGWLVGSPAFMSPEQAESRELTPASDVFSLGAVLFQACTGRVPFAGSSTLQMLYNVVHSEPDLTPLPDELRGLVERCLDKDPSQRPTPAGILELLGQLAPSARPWPAAVHDLIDAQQAEIARVLGLPEDGGALVASEAGTVVMRAEPGAGGTARLPVDPPVDPPTAPPHPDRPADALAHLPTAPQHPARPADPPASSPATPPAAPPAGTPRPTRRVLLLGALGAGVTAAVAVPLAVDRFSGSSAKGATGGSSSSGTSPSRTASPGPSASRSGSTAGGRKPMVTLSRKLDSMLTAVEFSPDGRFIALGDLDGGVELRYSPSLMKAAILSVPGEGGVDNATGDVAFSPDGSLLASIDNYATITLWEVPSGNKVATLHGDKNQKDSEYDSVAFSRDGKTLAYSSNTTITVWDVRSRDKVATLVDPAGPVTDVNKGWVASAVFTKDGSTLIASTTENKLHFWDIRRRSITATVQGGKDGLYDLALSPDGKVVAADAGIEGVRLWDTGSRKEIETLTFTSQMIGSVAFSPDGKSLAASEQGGAFQIWSTATWNPIRTFDESNEEVAKALSDARAGQAFADALAFSPDNKLLVESLDYYLALWKLT
ncbi:WD40 repeat domain-containing serine/threonine protein kinase [Streptomyces milbemycinicus]|uniref:WD40 repeat domain-containing serine/threonine protein kinase n=1 Tax=Streptomyces milbemycinicus TaxID=476552 RepID=UPI0033C3C306